ncbi:MAG: hypothetical protein JXR73_07980 [Candidatus Omnitrophica bacterium]|nr:hypothetical protein [Candidatus Omnitrophota bacterium]
MLSAIGQILLLPVKLVLVIIELLGRTLALFLGLVFFGIGALLCFMGPFIVIGAPLCLLSALLVIKAL